MSNSPCYSFSVLTGTIPEELGALMALASLVLNRNKLTGEETAKPRKRIFLREVCPVHVQGCPANVACFGFDHSMLEFGGTLCRAHPQARESRRAKGA